jgi:UDP-2-acetamido-2,6-beta-L-arabino-hexul-4-ose reductase
VESGEKESVKISDKELVDLIAIPGWNHKIINTGESPLIMVVWVNENFDPNNPDTFTLRGENAF